VAGLDQEQRLKFATGIPKTGSTKISRKEAEMKKAGFLLITLAVASWVLACGGDDGPTGPGSGLATSSLLDGTWAVTTSTYAYGSSACTGDTLVIEEEQVLCNATLESVHGFEDFSGQGFDCSLEGNGNTFSLECFGSLEQDPCMINFFITGAGTSSENSFSMYMDFVISASGPSDPCSGFDEPCTTRIEMTGTWVSAGGDCSPVAPLGADLVPSVIRERVLLPARSGEGR